MTDVPHTDAEGLKIAHAVISPACRANRGAEGAIDEALRRAKEQYMHAVHAPANARARYHVIITVDRWSDGTQTPSNGVAHGHG